MGQWVQLVVGCMAGYSDVEGEFSKGEEEEQGEEEAEEEDLPELTDREKFFLEVNQAEEHRMQFSEDEGESGGESQGEDAAAERQ